MSSQDKKVRTPVELVELPLEELCLTRFLRKPFRVLVCFGDFEDDYYEQQIVNVYQALHLIAKGQ